MLLATSGILPVGSLSEESLIGALCIHGLNPGPMLMIDQLQMF